MKEQEINRQWKRIVNTMNEGLMVIGPDGTIVMVNNAFERMTGYRADEIIGRPCTLLGCDACEGTLRQGGHFWCTLFENRGDINCRCGIRKKNGGVLPVLKKAALLEDEAGRPAGAVETFTDLSELDALDRKVNQLSRQLDEEAGFKGMIGESAPMQRVFDIVQKAARSDAPVIIYGESGTGKELAARAVHKLSPRKNRPFVMLNCAALNESLLESELFGHIKGAFTGAYRHRLGRFEAAHGGDIFLDEIGDVPLSIQVKLLRVLETKAFERVGEQEPLPVNVRIITATNKNLEEMIRRQQFREDFFFRINVIPIHLPPLRERKDDIPLLVSVFLERLKKRTGKSIGGLAADVMSLFVEYDWPGNVRELKSAMEYAFVLTEEGTIQSEHLPRQIRGKLQPVSGTSASAGGDAQEKQALIDALAATGGNQTQAAKLLGINRVTVWNRMRKYGIDLKKIIA
ncbi:MAG: sigma 54-interacting transcriptional regulator [Desulfobacterales bacterium]|nr:sigma 54-interacting transcriptional regulator [Desulfobacterales bacterium]